MSNEIKKFKETATKESIHYVKSIQIRFSSEYIEYLANAVGHDLNDRPEILKAFKQVAKIPDSVEIDFTCLKSSSPYYTEKRPKVAVADTTKELPVDSEKIKKAKLIVATLKTKGQKNPEIIKLLQGANYTQIEIDLILYDQKVDLVENPFLSL